MIKRGLITIIAIVTLVFLRIWFIPTATTIKNNECLCWYRFGVYKCHYIESEGEGERPNTPIPMFNIYIDYENKIGDLEEFLLLKKIKNDKNR